MKKNTSALKAKLFPVLFLFFFLSGAKAQAQNMDSLKLVVKNAKDDTTRCATLIYMTEVESDMNVWSAYNDRAKAICERNLQTLKPSDALYPVYTRFLGIVYSNMSYLYSGGRDVSKSLEYATKSIALLQNALKYTKNEVVKKDIYKRMATCYSNFTGNYKQIGNIPMAISYIEKSLKIDRQIGNKEGEGRELNNLAYMYNLQGDVQKALEYYFTSLKLREEMDDAKGAAVIRDNIGGIYLKQKNYPKALDQFEQSLKLSKQSKYGIAEARAYNDIGYCYLQQGKTDSAIPYFNKALKLRQELQDLSGIAESLINVATVHKELANTKYKDNRQKQDSLRKLALDEYYKSLSTYEQARDKSGSIFSLLNISSMIYRHKLGDLKTAKQLADTAFRRARELGYPNKIERAAYMLSLLYKEEGDYKNAYEMQVLHKQMSDSINNESNRKAIAEKTLQYEFEKKEALQNTAHEKELIENRNTRNQLIFAGLITILLLVSAFVFYNFRKNMRVKEEYARHLLTGQEKERQRIAKELHDGVGQHILFLRNQLVKLNNETLVTSADETLEEVRTLSKDLYPNQLEKYGLIAAVDALIKRVQDTTGVFASHDLEAFKQELSPEQQISCYRLIQECVSNALKHASATALRITATMVGKGIELVIQDDGRGFDKQKLKQAAHRSFGVLNLEERVRLLGGSTELETSPGNGTKWTFYIPV
jgi:signal transduction histidine kinase/Tfp pilus assembly protein PilF